MRKALFCIIIFVGFVSLYTNVFAYDFSAMASSGQTLYYTIRGSNVTVVPENSTNPYYSEAITGDLVIPNSVEYNGNTYIVDSINFSTFSGCNDLLSVIIPNTVRSIAYRTFAGCKSLHSVSIPNSVTDIGASAFYGCTALTDINIPGSVVSIGASAFENCYGLCYLNIPPSVTSIGEAAFTEIKNVIYNGEAVGSPWGAHTVNGYVEESLVFYDASKEYITGCCTSVEGSIIIPSSVRRIGKGSFSYCNGLTVVTIPDSVTLIDTLAFFKCIGLRTVNFDAISCTMRQDGDFYSAFKGCDSLTTVVIGNSVRMIPDYAFRACGNLSNVTIGNSVETIGRDAFAGCGFCSLVIPNSVTTIKTAAFLSCRNLESINIPNSVTEIYSEAFTNCYSATKLVLGRNVTTIGYEAFEGCVGLLEIRSNATIPPSLGNNAFKNVAPGIPIYVPCERIPLYSYNWSYFSNFIENPGYNLNVSSIDVQMGVAMVTAHPSCTNPVAVLTAYPNSGYQFDHWSNGSTYNPLTIAIVDDTDITAYFRANNGIDDISAENIKVYVNGRNIVIEGSLDESVTVYDVMGRTIYHDVVRAPITAPAAGVYMVKIGNAKARKVVILR